MNWKKMGLLAGGITLLLRFVFSCFPVLTEHLYSRGLFVGIRYIQDYTLGLSPFPLFYPLLVLAFLFFTWKILHSWYEQHKKTANKPTLPWKKRWQNRVLALGGIIGFIITFSYFIWGFNYWRLPIETHLKLNLLPLDETGIRLETHEAFKRLKEASTKINNVSFEFAKLETELREDSYRLLRKLNYPAPGRVRLRELNPGSPVLIFGVAGFNFFPTGEAYVPASLLPPEIPFFLAHETAHALGFCEEGTANFLAYLICIQSRNPMIQYSGHFSYFFFIARELYAVAPTEYDKLYQELPQLVRFHHEAIKRNVARYRGFLMDFGQTVNDTYLKSQGIGEGIKSYNRIVVLTTAWRKSPGAQ